MRFLFHAGLGATDSSSIPAELKGSGPVLKEHGTQYLGMWAPWLGPGHDSLEGFRRFLDVLKARMGGLTDLVLTHAKRIGDETGAQTFIHSNEERLDPSFFEAVAKGAEVKVIVFVRAPDRWLPSANLRWSILHEARQDEVPAFGEAARGLLSQYEWAQLAQEALGPRLVIRPYPESGDILDDFSDAIGIPLAAPARSCRTKSGITEARTRSAIGGVGLAEQLPAVSDVATNLPEMPFPIAQAGCDRLIDRSELTALLAESKATFDWTEAEFGIPMGTREQDRHPAPGFAELADGLPVSIGRPRRRSEREARLPRRTLLELTLSLP